MAKVYDKQIETMQRLINYGVNENTNNGKSVVEYHAEGADGKTYGIIRECNKFYIKVAPKKDTALVAEDYDYIGGFNNRKENEYSSYNVASKQFELKMKSLNEAYQNNKKSTYQFKPVETAEWQINETKEMRAEINRFNDIMHNVNGILSEDKNFTMKHTLPEAPASNPSVKKVNGPFTDTAVANGDKDFKTTSKNHQKVGPFSVDGVIDDADMQSTKNPTSTSNGNVYTEKPKYVQTGVAGKQTKGGKIVKVNESQVLAWSKDKNFLDKKKGTKIGSLAPFTEECQIEIEGMCEDTCESKIYKMVKEAITLNDFGKHPAYDKTPMTLPSTIEIELNGAHDWNDESTKGEEPFGKKIGSNAPYTLTPNKHSLKKKV